MLVRAEGKPFNMSQLFRGFCFGNQELCRKKLTVAMRNNCLVQERVQEFLNVTLTDV